MYGELGIKSDFNVVNSINNKGDIVGFSGKSLFHKGKVYRTQNVAVVWKASENWKISELLPYDDSDSMALKINNFGHVVCEKRMPFHSHGQPVEQFLFNANENKMIPFSNAQKINNDSIKYLYTNTSGVALTSSNKIAKFYQLLPSGEAQLSYFCFTEYSKKNFNNEMWKQVLNIKGVNNSLWVVGSAINIYGETHAVLLVPANNP